MVKVGHEDSINFELFALWYRDTRLKICIRKKIYAPTSVPTSSDTVDDVRTSNARLNSYLKNHNLAAPDIRLIKLLSTVLLNLSDIHR